MSLKYFKRSNLYKNYNGDNLFDPIRCEAISYQWWLYYKEFGKVKVFNSYHYSNTTCKHQSVMRSFLIDTFNTDFNNVWDLECPKGLQDLDSGIELYTQRIKDLELLIKKPRTHKLKNEERKELIAHYTCKIDQLTHLKEV